MTLLVILQTYGQKFHKLIKFLPIPWTKIQWL